MDDKDKTKEQLIEELVSLRAQIVAQQPAKADTTGHTIDQFVLKKAIDQSAHAIAVADMDVRILYANRAALTLFGFDSPTQILGQSPVNSWVSQIVFADNLAKLLETGSITLDYSAQRLDGSLFDAHIIASIIEDDFGEPINILASIEDITEQNQLIASLRTSEENYRGLFDNALVAMFKTALTDGKPLAANKAAAQLFGYETTADFIAEFRSANHYMDPADRLPVIQTLNEHGHIDRISLHSKKKDSTPFWSEGSFRLNREGGYVDCVAVDVTERKLTQETIRASEAEQRHLVSNLNVGVVVHGADTVIQFGNPMASKLLGLTPDQMLGKEDMDPAWNFLREDHSVMPVEEYPVRRVARTGQPIEGQIVGTVHTTGASSVWALVNAFPEFDAHHQLQKIVVTFQDITEIKRAATELQEMSSQVKAQAEQLQWIMDSVPEGLLVMDAERRILLANPAAQNDLQVLTDPPGQIGEILTQLGTLSLDEVITPDLKGIWHRITGHDRTYEVIAKPLKKGTNTDGWVLVLRDISKDLKLQHQIQEQERLAAIGRFAAGIAHDFNNILAVITLYAGLSGGDAKLTDAQRNRWHVVENQTKQAASLIQQLLDFGRRSAIEVHSMDLQSLIKEMVKLFRRTVSSSIQIHWAQSEAQCTIKGDPTRLQQVMMNLVGNAQDAMPDGGVLSIELDRLSLQTDAAAVPLLLYPRLEADISNTEWVRLTVTDTGHGVLPKDLPHIFDPFYTTKEQGKGTGLGLAQVFGIVKQLEGEIEVTSQPG
ncbi:MAG: PAS domain S-box protein, partial [Caldilineaceae bacterium]